VPESTWVYSPNAGDIETVRDEFSTVSYAGNNGTLDWLGSWTEVNESDGASTGDEMVLNVSGNNYGLQIRDNDGGGEGVQRAVNLGGAVSAELSLQYQRNSLDSEDEYVTLSVSTDGQAWTDLDTYAGPATDNGYVTATYDLTPYISSSTYIRLLTSSALNDGDMVFFDNIQVEMVYPAEANFQGNPPPALLTNYTMIAGQVVTVTFTAMVDFVDDVMNQAYVTTDSDPTGLYDGTYNYVDALAMTQGLPHVQGLPDAAQLSWIAGQESDGTFKSYDLLYVDRATTGFESSTSNDWALVATVPNTHCIDPGGEGRPAPGTLGKAMRFYRVSREGRWMPNTGASRFASPEVYVLKNLELKEGENWVSLFMVPDNRSLANVFGTDVLPAGPPVIPLPTPHALSSTARP
jgi:hypothetical protein